MGFQQGLSGLNVSGKALDVTGNNIANASTTGFKSSTTNFSDVYGSQMVVGTASPVGIGVNVGAVIQHFTQGGITTTTNPLDLAINGNGFFAVSTVDSVSGVLSGVSYTRNGQMHLDKDGFLINDQGMSLLGVPAKADGTIPEMSDSLMQALNAYDNTGDPKATTSATLQLNLNAEEALGGTYTRSMAVYDSQGGKCSLAYTFTKDATTQNKWAVSAILTDTAGNTHAGTIATASLGAMAFNTDGTLNTTTTTTPFTCTFGLAAATPATGVADLVLEVDVSAVTQYKSPYSVVQLTQDGYGKGELTGLNISEDGTIQARYDTGKTTNIGRIALYSFANPNGLEPLGANVWGESYASGQAIGNYPGSGNTGVIKSSSVEDSNVDLTKELVDMIVMQRNYQANAQAIKTQDAILQTLVNLR